jgi:hypothetical protein
VSDDSSVIDLIKGAKVALISYIRDLIYIKRSLFYSKMSSISYKAHYFNYNVGLIVITTIIRSQDDIRIILMFSVTFSNKSSIPLREVYRLLLNEILS